MEQKVSILVVDDEEIVRESLSSWLQEDGYEVVTAENGPRALDRLPEKDWTLLLVDLKMPGMDGLQLMEEVHKIHPDMVILIMTAFATVDTAVNAMKQGAYDYLVKPFDPEDLSMSIRKIVEHKKLVQENEFLRKELKKQYRLHDMISKNDEMLGIFEMVQTISKSGSTVLIQGESGTGKELLARAIHEESDRRTAPFISVSCAALTETLLESELFGHEKGAFTGADSQKRGKLELARNGTLFLDEIGDISLKLQQDLLRVLEQKEFSRVGGNQVIPIESRIIAATNRDLRKAIEEGKFREDLFYRLNVFSFRIPPLRDRKEDIPLLVESFIDKFNIEMGKQVEGVTDPVMRRLMDLPWPGNARELRNVIERAMVVARGTRIGEADLDLHAVEGKATAAVGAGRSLEEIEVEHIRQVLAANSWNIQRSAQILGIDRATLYKKIRKHDLKKED